MKEIKNLVTKLLQVSPSLVAIDNSGGCATYYSNNTTYSIFLYKNDDYNLSLSIDSGRGYYEYSSKLTEKEFMELKWTIEKWSDDIENKTFDEFRDFVNSNANPADDLLNDD